MSQPNLFDYNYSLDLPNQDQFPLNIKLLGHTVREILLKDLRDSNNYFIITGFTSLSNLIEVFGAHDHPTLDKLRILIGYEPDERVGRNLPHYSLPTEIKNYWLRQNVSIRLCGPILNIIGKIEEGKFEFRIGVFLPSEEIHSVALSGYLSMNEMFPIQTLQ